MAQCISPWSKKINGQNTTLPCGKCYNCKARRVSGWSFRLLKQAEVSTSAFFLTLTYSPENVPITDKNYMTLLKSDLQKFLKRLRKSYGKNNKNIKYYACGEYGSTTMRPHYHMVLFNADEQNIIKAWNLGNVHFGNVSPASVGYTLKYMSKDGMIPKHQNDDRQKEFSLMSKKMGLNYLTPQMVQWHKNDLEERMYIPLLDGKKIAMPRYYKDKIYTQYQKDKIINHLKTKQLISDSKLDLSTLLKQMEKEDMIRRNIATKKKEQRKNLTL